ncbi:MAG: SLBB domain-containing protein, partial [Spirochaetaceae bacterium]|nr:SLBB domain-containing protein [Spirochaetaceae bacterium]
GDMYRLHYSLGVSSQGAASSVEIPIIIDSSYRVRVANFGVANADGKTFQQLKRQVEAIVLEAYPLSSVQFTLATPATFMVNIKGEVVSARTIEAWALSRLSDVLILSGQGEAAQSAIAGGQAAQSVARASVLTDFASIRDVAVQPAAGEKKIYDLFTATRTGDFSQNPYMRPGDTITVSRLSRKITISGAVERPGTYQLLDGENLKELISYYGGGYTLFADKASIELVRYSKNQASRSELIKMSDAEVNAGYELLDHDVITVRPLTNMYPAITIESASTYYVTVAGSVRAPGRYPYAPNRNWRYYIALAGGFIKGQNAFEAVAINNLDGKRMNKKSVILPETVITASTNDPLFYWNQYAPVVTTVLSIMTTYFSLQAYLRANK